MRWRRWVVGAVALTAMLYLGAAEFWRQAAMRGMSQAIADQGGRIEASFRTVPLPLWPRDMRAEISNLTLPVEGVRLQDVTLRTGTPLPHRVEIAADGPVALASPTGPVEIRADTLTGFALVARRPALPLEEVTLVGEALSVSLPGEDQLGLDGLDLRLVHRGEGLYDISLDASGLVPAEQFLTVIDPGGQLAPIAGPFVLRGQLGFAAPLSPRHDPQPALQTLRIREGVAEWGRMRLSGQANLSFDARGRGNGDIDLALQGWEEILQLAEDAGMITVDVAARLRLALRFSANLNNDAALRVSLNAVDGVLYLGPIPVGEMILPQN